MLVEPNTRRRASAHVIVLGNEKGGSGKSTTAMHVAVALMNVGQRVATIDLDSRQKSFTHYVDNRRTWAKRAQADLKVPPHFCVARGLTLKLDENEQIEFSGFAEAVTAVEQSHDFIVVDTPGTDSYLTRLAHSMADTLITPLNDSFVDLDVLGIVDGVNYEVTDESHYAEMVRDARRQRRLVDGSRMDWIVVRNRLSTLGSRNKRLVAEGAGVGQPTWLSGRRRPCRADDLSGALSPRADGAGPARPDHAWNSPQRVARDGAGGGDAADRSIAAAARCPRPAACGCSSRMVRRA